MASAVTTPQPPAVVITDDPLPRGQRLGGEGGGGLERLLDGGGAGDAGLAAGAVEDASSVASEPVWLAAARCPPEVAPPLTSTSGMRCGDRRAGASKNARPSSMPST